MTAITTTARRISREMKALPVGWWASFDADGRPVERGEQNTWPAGGYAPHAYRLYRSVFDRDEDWSWRATQDALDNADLQRAMGL